MPRSDRLSRLVGLLTGRMGDTTYLIVYHTHGTLLRFFLIHQVSLTHSLLVDSVLFGRAYCIKACYY